ncbi:2Fe-2S iron-sulfur cluster binding domain-containing protein [Nitriliruptoraceae bacterium ZYF776]|nr:2Fe-2S iron-sulfur cluster binding domain-containing protein [Profundirhabdus halotolerans]
MEHELCVDDRTVALEIATADTLADALRQAGETQVKVACARGECGSCTVLVAGTAVHACGVLACMVTGPVTTAASADDAVVAVREAFADAGAFQCGFCTPGMVARAAALVASEVPFDDHRLRHELAGNVCRCTGYVQILRAIRAAWNRRHGGTADATTTPSEPAEGFTR